MIFFILGCNDNPVQFMGAYRKLLLHNEVMSGKDSNCVNDITKALYVPSTSKKVISINKAELELISNFDFENQVDMEDAYRMEIGENSLEQHSMANTASVLELTVLKKNIHKGKNRCTECFNVFLENEITDDSFIEYKSNINNTLPPCKSTIEIMVFIDNVLKIYDSINISFNSMLIHIMKIINIDRFYGNSSFDEHNHKHEFIELVIKSYMDIKSTEECKRITNLSQKNRIRHENLKNTHLSGQ